MLFFVFFTVCSLVSMCSCSVGSSLVPPFIGQSPAGSEALTDSFEAFRFSGYDTVFFECVADFCYGENDLACLGVLTSSCKLFVNVLILLPLPPRLPYFYCCYHNYS